MIRHNFFENFRKQRKTEIGRQFPKSDTSSPPLNIEVTLATFNSSGKTPDCKEKLHAFFYKQHFYKQRQAEIGNVAEILRKMSK